MMKLKNYQKAQRIKTIRNILADDYMGYTEEEIDYYKEKVYAMSDKDFDKFCEQLAVKVEQSNWEIDKEEMYCD